ncbi:hypothetical protein [Sphingosinicella sp. YJ22]|uniref:hypothetical protein n=1 Tax=Sphingosinicella sp. YJ22 TaxID=1104780 RepID=UPI00140A3780|nr:hypothetical protein [Sphingosinicella sp. YJ22]
MELTYYREREQQERAFAAQALSEAARTAHLDLAKRYRAVIEAHERLEQVVENRPSAAA